MTSLVNRKFAIAAEQAQPGIRKYLVQVFKAAYKTRTAEVVEDIAAFMGRHVTPAEAPTVHKKDNVPVLPDPEDEDDNPSHYHIYNLFKVLVPLVEAIDAQILQNEVKLEDLVRLYWQADAERPDQKLSDVDRARIEEIMLTLFGYDDKDSQEG